MTAEQIQALHKRFNSIGTLLDNVHQQVGLIHMDLLNDDTKYSAINEDLTRAMDSVAQAASVIDAAHHDFYLSLGEGE